MRITTIAAGAALAILLTLELLFRAPFGGAIRFVFVQTLANGILTAFLLIEGARGVRPARAGGLLGGAALLAMAGLGIFAPAMFSTVFGYPTDRFYDVFYALTGAVAFGGALIPRRHLTPPTPTPSSPPTGPSAPLRSVQDDTTMSSRGASRDEGPVGPAPTSSPSTPPSSVPPPAMPS